MRVKASAVGLTAEEYRAELAVDSGWTGMDALDLAEQQMSQLWEHETIALADVATGFTPTRGEHQPERPALPHGRGAAQPARLGARPGDRRQARAAGPR